MSAPRLNPAWLLPWLVGSVACAGQAEPRPEWLVSISTDAPVPQLGERLLVETLNEDGELACDGCRRVLAAGDPGVFPVSFSVIPSGERLRLRTRLYRARVTGSDGSPQTEQLIEHVGFLPETSGRRRLAVRLALDCFGIPADWQKGRSCSADSGELEPLSDLTDAAPLEPGSSTLATTRGCDEATPAGMACIPGGLFVRGDEAAISLDIKTNARPEQLVQLSPFFLDEDEITVGQVRALLVDGAISSAPARRGPSSDDSRGCTFLGPNDASNDDYPANCVRLSQAKDVCAALGKRLPTEAEWEYAAGNLDLESRFPWGSDPNICDYAILSRANLDLSGQFGGEISCLGLGAFEPLTSPKPGGSELDVTRRGIRNLSGNVAELLADEFSAYDGPCWGDERVLVDPRCDETDLPDFAVTLRGSAWSGSLLQAPGTARNSINEGAAGDPGTGFRCAKNAE